MIPLRDIADARKIYMKDGVFTSEKEYSLKQEKGLEAPESLFEQEDIDVFDIYRNSVL